MLAVLKKAKHRLWHRQPSVHRSPQKWLPSKVYAERFNARWHSVYPASQVDRELPIGYGSRSVDLASQLCSDFPELGVLELKQGRLYGSSGWVVGDDDYLLPEPSWFGLNVNEMQVPPQWGETEYVPGVCLSLASDWSCQNYGHFLLDGLSRLHLVEQAGFSLENIDRIYCPTSNPDRAISLLKKFNLPIDKCIFTPYPSHCGIQADTLLVPSFPGIRRNYPDWVPQFLQRMVVNTSVVQHRRLYITRGTGTRKVMNESSLLPLLDHYGFELYNPMNHADPPRDFAEAAIVVGAHGAGLTDLAFCQPGTCVLELMPSDHVYPYYCSLSQAAHLPYGYLVGDSIQHRIPKAFGPSPYDFRVDEDEFHYALTHTIQRRESRSP